MEPFLRKILGVIIIDDFQTIRAESMNTPQLTTHAVYQFEKWLE